MTNLKKDWAYLREKISTLRLVGLENDRDEAIVLWVRIGPLDGIVVEIFEESVLDLGDVVDAAVTSSDDDVETVRLSELVGSFLGESHLLDGTVDSGLNVLPVHVVLFPANLLTVEFGQDSLLGMTSRDFTEMLEDRGQSMKRGVLELCDDVIESDINDLIILERFVFGDWQTRWCSL